MRSLNLTPKIDRKLSGGRTNLRPKISGFFLSDPARQMLMSKSNGYMMKKIREDGKFTTWANTSTLAMVICNPEIT